ncbi:mediator of RNA polymerase II transcription subunit 21 isoform X1 [Malania oleifera]|uniref:mediator of RNA polymerase II transcription subunit 21 isoform X1 n=1 Tax=Malania oleifera TaxID=397392 RepID=UPI0025AEAB01|nr:mediator of RNA polymerase II transcription subunit 21 isoform X1 [Malania oleifera]
MDIISQLQEQINTIAALAFNTFGTLQRDAPPVRLSPNYPEPPPNPTGDSVNTAEQTKTMSAALVKAAKQFDVLVAALPLSEGGEEAQLKRIAELQVRNLLGYSFPIHHCFYTSIFLLHNFIQAENDAVGQELQKQLEAAGWPLFDVFLFCLFFHFFGQASNISTC